MGSACFDSFEKSQFNFYKAIGLPVIENGKVLKENDVTVTETLTSQETIEMYLKFKT